MDSTTKQQTWPTQLDLPGQASVAEGPVALDAMYLMHHAFRRDLTAFTAAARSTPVSDRAAWRALAERWTLFSETLHHHHSGEDAGLWPLLLDRADQEGRETLEAMEAEHAEIDPLLEGCAAGFRRLAATADEDARVALAARLEAARDSLGRHLVHEETEALPLVQRLMSQAEWERMEEEHFKKGLQLSRILQIVPWASYGVPAHVRERLLRESGWLFRVVWRLTRRRFARREQVAFAHIGG
ncbi:hemerythrin domain-containing protein [Nocardioides pakistanensis]